jgi:polysaccharide export outer membrane protein
MRGQTTGVSFVFISRREEIVSKVRNSWLSVVILIAGLPPALWSRQGTPDVVPGISVQATVLADGQEPSGRSTLQQRYPRYQVQRDDVLSITFPLSPEFNQTVTIQPDGYVNLQGAGSLHIEGMTVPEVVEALKKAYASTLHNPIIDVDLKDFQKAYFIASGQVGKPGKYDLRYDTNVSEAIAIAGGFTPQAKTQVFLFRCVSSGWFEVKQLNVKDILNGKNVDEDARLRPGDMIFVPEKFIAKFRKYVPYGLGVGINPAALASML